MSACGVCSTQVPDGADRCPSCGFAVGGRPPATTSAPASTTSLRPSPAAPRPTPSLRPNPGEARTVGSLRPSVPSTPSAPKPAPERLPTMNRAPPPLESEAATSVSQARTGGPMGSGATIAGKYLVLESIGQGGMGHVWKARHVGLDSLVAIKVLRADMARDTENLARIEQEARTASRLRHPNSIEMKDVGSLPDGGLYMVMEYVQGRDLASVLAKEWPLGEARICHIVAQVLAALSAAHKAGVVHRDLKAENVMLERIGEDPDFVKVLDFGIATTASPANGQVAREVSGTPQYMSPEQATGLAVDHRSDLYATGVLLYRLVTGHYPFEGASAIEVLEKHAREAPVPPRQRRPDARCSADLEALILRAMSKDPARRPASAEAFRKELLAIEERAKSPVLRLASEMAPGPTTSNAAPAKPANTTTGASQVGVASQDERLKKAVARARFWRKNKRAIAMITTLGVLYGAFRLADFQTGGEVSRIAKEKRDVAAQVLFDAAMAQKRKWDELQRKGPLNGVKPPPGFTPPPPPAPAAPAPAPAPAPATTPAPSAVETAATAATEAANKAVAAVAKAVRSDKPAASAPATSTKGLGAASDPRCPAGMVFVEGATFPWGEKGGPHAVILVGVRDFCIDRFEFPNLPGAQPKLVGGVGEASTLCIGKGRRLCRDEEWEHACKGPDDLPLPYGRTAEPDACNTAGADGAARALAKAGTFERCVSGYGAADMVGNAPEWVSAAKEPGSTAKRKGGGSGDAGSCSRDAGGSDQEPSGFRCCADPR